MIKFVTPLLLVLAGCQLKKPVPVTPPMPPPKSAALTRQITVNALPPTTHQALSVTSTFQQSTNLRDWQTLGTMTEVVSAPAGSAFFRSFLTIAPYTPAPAIATYHSDNARTGANTNETALNPLNVNTNTFGLLFTCPVDNWLYAQPLFVPGVAGHNAVYAASLSNTVYAFDADRGALMWQTNFGNPVVVAEWTNDFPSLGILGTPTIDVARGRLYAVSWTAPASYSLHVLNITNGVELASTAIAVSTNVSFNQYQYIQRCALLLDYANVYLAWACASGDGAPSCIMAYDADTLIQNAFWNTGGGGIWMSGCGPASDGTGVYFSIGNYELGATNVLTPPQSYQDSVVKLSPGLLLKDFFCPSNAVALSTNDVDLGSGGVLLVPNGMVTACGKEGIMFVLSSTNLGGFNPTNQVVQQFNMGAGMWSSPAFFNGLLFFQGNHGLLESYLLTTNGFVHFSSASSSYSLYPPMTPVISANGTNAALCWALQTDTVYAGDGTYDSTLATNGVAILHAYSAYNLQELWNSEMVASDGPGAPVKFTVPVVANGKVYVGTQNRLAVYGLKNGH